MSGRCEVIVWHGSFGLLMALTWPFPLDYWHWHIDDN